jgi:hypothetical protein
MLDRCSDEERLTRLDVRSDADRQLGVALEPLV